MRTYDAIGRKTSMAVASTGSAWNMTYDNNGNMTSVTNSCGTTTYTWDVRNRLVRINGFTVNCSQFTASFKYDAVGRRIEKMINGRTIQYVYDGIDIVLEIDIGLPSVNYVRTLNIDEPLARIQSNGEVRYYQTDALGSVIALTDETGTIRTQYTYDPFGNVTITGEASDNPFQYTGRENDGAGLYYYRARYYSPELQHFISEDPIGLKGGINKFVYTDNNPVNETDPLGLLADEESGPIIGPPPTELSRSGWWECGKKRANCYARAHWEYEMCMRGGSRDYDKCQTKNDNCFERMRFRLEECLRNADKSCKKVQ